MGKKLALLSILFLSANAWAVNPRILTVTNTYFPGEGINYYAQAERELAQSAVEFCSSFQEKVDRISNIQIQIQSEFELKNEGKTEALTHPHVLFSALVTCRQN